jgi:UDP-2-acetamido-3-amino-2,3-dideoxy-glucuronate N-acetyltransferase
MSYLWDGRRGGIVLIAPGASVSSQATVPESAKVWDLAQIREGATLGEHVIIGRGAYVGGGVRIGAETKIQNYALVYEPAELGIGVFVGPGVILTNDKSPRAVTPGMQQKQPTDWEPVGVRVLDGASIGAGAICVAPITIGRWAMVAAGAVVVSDVADYALVAGNPARRIGWVGKSGVRLSQVESMPGTWTCSKTNETFIEDGAGGITPMDDTAL